MSRTYTLHVREDITTLTSFDKKIGINMSIANSSMFLGQWELTEEKPTSRVVIEPRVSPCDGCVSHLTCRTQKMACSAFIGWVNSDKVRLDSGVSYFTPSAFKYTKIFGNDRR